MRTTRLPQSLTLVLILCAAVTAGRVRAKTVVQAVTGDAETVTTAAGSVQSVVTLAAADEGQSETVTSRTLLGVLNHGPEAAARLGHFGCLVIRDKARWEARSQQFNELGWTRGLQSPEPIDFSRQWLVAVFRAGVPEAHLSSMLTKGDAATPALAEISVNYPTTAPAADAGMSLVVIFLVPAQQAKISVNTVEKGAKGAAAAKKLAWSALFKNDSADVVDGLRGQIRAKAATVKAGADIEVEFTLQLADFAVDKTSPLAPPGGVVRVWDGKYSNGYRNHAFEVTTPDGKTLVLRPPARDFEKNAPHAVAIKADAPYVLPEWSEGVTFKSLKALGLDTSNPGKYVITGLYDEAGGTQKDRNGGQDVTLWGGSIATNTITVEVTAR